MIKQGWHPLILFTLPLCAIGSLTFLDTATAQQVTQQVTPDGTVSTTVTTPDGKNFNINDGTRRGGNLFHSFKEFSVPTGGSANFNNALDVQNIISRVTGGSVSNINGAITALGKANVFLLNPAGIIFGPNASLRIGGSFLGSTANSFLFDNNFEFSATDPQAPPLLTINVPIGLGFRNNPGAIEVRGPVTGSGLVSEVKPGNRPKLNSNVTGLQVELGKTLALVGGNVSVEGGVLRSEGGRIEIGSFDSNQIVNLVPAQSEGFSLAYQGTPNFRDIEFSNKSFVNVTGDGSGSIAILGRNINFTSDSILLSDTLGDKNGGEISIVGDSIAFNRSSLLSNTFGSGNGGQIKLEANKINFENSSSVSIQTQDNKGNAGNIKIRANSLEMKGGSSLLSITTGNSSGKAGDINVTVNGPMAITTGGIQTDSGGAGNAGNININANSLQIDRSGVFSRALYTGQGGEINFNVADSLTIKGITISTNTYFTGDAGKININANSFRLENGGVLSEAVNSTSTGKAGEINITVAGTLELPQSAGISTTTAGKGEAGKINIRAGSFLLERSGVSSSTTGNSTGNAGKINITAGSFRLEGGEGVSSKMGENSTGEGGEININVADSLTIYNTSGITTDTSGKGDAGKININANSFRLEGAGVNSKAQANSTGKAGEINITVAGTLELPKFAGIETSTAGIGEAGKINITAGSFLLERSQVSSNTQESGTGNAGEIKITVADKFDLNATDVRTNNLGTGNGGNIQIKANNFYLTNGSQVLASASRKGNGGSVTVHATGNVSADGRNTTNGNKSGFYSTVESSGVGNAGGVNISARSLSLSNGGTISTSNSGNGAAGNITVTTPKDILLDNQGSIRAETRGGKGNISLNARDLILRRNSDIVADATGSADGGNININVAKGFILTTPGQDSDIIARASSGQGGTITIRSLGLFGIAERAAIEGNGTNDIDTRSQFGLQGTVNINTLETDPTQGLFELTETVIDPAQQVAQNPCIKGFGSTFTITGRGGLPTDPNKILSSDNVRVDLVEPVPSKVSSTTATQKQPSQQPTVKRIVPAQGWIYNEKGQVVLVAYDPTKTGPQRQQPAPTSNCAAVR
ncbi:filamentous hemagglutinin N-terminal domain-containing protein [Brasilonema sp. CT11]|nr:filamentous hemagglutinin N-terminal domain-containing protein [Brasilonema sp. CT11]